MKDKTRSVVKKKDSGKQRGRGTARSPTEGKDSMQLNGGQKGEKHQQKKQKTRRRR